MEGRGWSGACGAINTKPLAKEEGSTVEVRVDGSKQVGGQVEELGDTKTCVSCLYTVSCETNWCACFWWLSNPNCLLFQTKTII